MRESRICRLILLIVLLVILVNLGGCGTLRGAATGFKDDWQVLKRFDTWFKEHWW